MNCGCTIFCNMQCIRSWFDFIFLPVSSEIDCSLAELKMYSLMMSANGHVDSRGNLPPPIIMRTAATPMPTPKSSLGTDSIFSLEESRRGSGISIDPIAYDQRSLVSGFAEKGVRRSALCFVNSA